MDDLDPSLEALIARRAAVLGPAYRLFYARPIEFVRGEGVRLYDRDGVAYLDAYNNVPCVGHCNEDVVAAVNRQVRILNTNTRYVDRPIVDYAERLLATHDDQLTNVMFACSGSEANDLALRIARYATDRTGVVVTTYAYHGVTSAIAEVSPSLGPHETLGPHVRTVAPPTVVDDPHSSGTAFAARVSEAIADLARHGTGTAAVLMDTLFANDGLIPDPAGFLRPVVEATRDAGALFVADEVQAGFGRSGEQMWGYQRHGVSPDLVTMGKPMGNGMPISAVACRPELLKKFGRDIRYFNTFGGNSVAIAAATAVLDVLERDDLLANARTVGGYLLKGLTGIARRSVSARNVRGAGLFLSLDIVHPETGEADPDAARQIVNGLRDRRVLISRTGLTGSALKIRPPLPFSCADADELLFAFADVLGIRGY